MTEFSHCPDCSTPLGKDRAKCRCGWTSVKPETPAQPLPPGHIQCAANAGCRKPGRLWIEPYLRNERICVDHYYAELEKGARAQA